MEKLEVKVTDRFKGYINWQVHVYQWVKVLLCVLMVQVKILVLIPLQMC